jgi:hypothetical protein
MTAYQVYRFYLAIKLHFTQEKYDVFAKRGAVKSCTVEEFNRKNFRMRFEILAKKLKEPQQAVQFFVANQAYGGDVFDVENSETMWTRWRKHKEMTSYLIKEDLEKIGDLNKSLSGSPCPLIKEVSAGRINIETAVAINRKLHFTGSWKQHNFAYPDLWLKIEKLDRFVKFNEETIFEKIDEIYSTTRPEISQV